MAVAPLMLNCVRGSLASYSLLRETGSPAVRSIQLF
jgi:hypothetical protein